jgi:hypothetical protein
MPTRQRSRPSRGAALPPVAEVSDGSIPDALPDVKLTGAPIPLPDRETRIAVAAYRRAESRGFEPGYELDDWLAAEREVDAGDGVGSTANFIREPSTTEH